ncbi:hypothetical protein K6W21_01585 [Burkholderia latens]|uniref:hypothetical protein n=1 Tax=Burkholderia latens TaxID=488446 RepID=UPI001C95A927|nr:hypothetical protein [Burkholderia latens]MBY4692780.1 hypothetical protein [Burkholderia latens]
MSDSVFSEEGEFFTFSTVLEREPGLYEASVLFERKSDHVRTLVPAMRHKLTERFNDRDVAMQAALQYAHDRAYSGDVGF